MARGAVLEMPSARLLAHEVVCKRMGEALSEEGCESKRVQVEQAALWHQGCHGARWPV